MRFYFSVVLVAAVLASSMLASGDQAISMTVRPAIAPYRGNAQIKVLVSRDEKNRTLVWEVDGPNYYRSSSLELEGASAPRSYFFLARDLPAGDFEVRATIRRNDRSTSMAVGRLKVVGGPE
jgi:hypothetical protein